MSRRVAELAKALDMSEDKVMEIMQIAREPASLETPIGEEDDSNLGDFVADDNAVTPEGNVESVMLREHIDALARRSEGRENVRSLSLRFGLGGRPSENTGGSRQGVQRNQRAYSSDRGKSLKKAEKPSKKQENP